MVALSVLLPAELKNKLVALAAADHRHLSSFVKLALAAHVARTSKSNGSAAIADIGSDEVTHLAGGGQRG